MRALKYLRWSSAEQGEGTTLERQRRLTTRWITERDGWTDAGEITDEGVSAFTGENIEIGALAKFVREVEQGRWPGTALVVESMDRISRLPAHKVITWLSRVTDAGLTIISVTDRLHIDADSLSGDDGTLYQIVAQGSRAHGESSHKSIRVASAWDEKRQAWEAGNQQAFTSLAPPWLTLERSGTRRRGDMTTTWHLLPERVEIVRRVFAEALAGHGRRSIARRLNMDGVPTWGRGDSRAAGWQNSYIQKLLTNRSVLGEYQPHRKAKRDVRRTPVGDPLPGYFPQIISDEDFARVNRDRVKVPGVRGRMNNLLRGIATCAGCGASMSFVKKTIATADRREESYLVCDGYRRAMGCGNRNHFNYPFIQAGLLDALLPLALDEAYFERPDEIGRLTTALATLDRELEHHRVRAARAMDLFLESGLAAARERAIKAEREAEEAEGERKALADQLTAARGAVSPTEHLKRVQRVSNSLDAEDEAVRLDARSRVSVALQEVVTKLTFRLDRTVQAVVANGLIAFEFDDRGNQTNRFDLRDRPDLHPGLTRGELASNARLVDDILNRAREDQAA